MSKQPKKIEWQSKEVFVKDITPTLKNYKIKTELGKERLHQSLKLFGLAGNVVVNAKDAKGKYNLIDGNSRLVEAKEKGQKKMWVSYPSRKLTPEEFKEMSAMFDFAKAGEVDEEMIKGDLGKTKEFFDRWNWVVPKELKESLDKMGSKKETVMVESAGKKGKEKKEVVKEEEFQINLFFTQAKEAEFRKMEEMCAKHFSTESTSETIFEALRYCTGAKLKIKKK
jgi:gluconate kinase